MQILKKLYQRMKEENIEDGVLKKYIVTQSTQGLLKNSNLLKYSNTFMTAFNEAQLEQAFVELFKAEGYDYVHGENISRDTRDVL